MSAAGTRSGGRSRPAKKRTARDGAISTVDELEQYVKDLEAARKKVEDEGLPQGAAEEGGALCALSSEERRVDARDALEEIDARGIVWRREAGYPSIPYFYGSRLDTPVTPLGVLVLPASLERMDREPSVGAGLWQSAFPGEVSEYPICTTFDPLAAERPKPTGVLVANSLDAAVRAPPDSAWMSDIGTPWETVIVDLQQAKLFVVVLGCDGVAELDGRSCAALLELFTRKGDAAGRRGQGKTKAAKRRAKKGAAAVSGTAEDEGKKEEEEEVRGRSLRADLEANLSEEELPDLLRVFTVE